MSKFISITIFSLVLLMGCMPDKLDKWDVDNTLPVSEGSTDSSELATISTADMILVDITKESKDITYDITHKLHAEGSVSNPCEIQTVGTPGAPVEQLCWLDVEEYDLYTIGNTFKFYASETACEYVTYTGFYFYNWQPGTTQTSGITVHSGDQACIAGRNTVVPSCQFDHSRNEGVGPNCDSGSVTYSTMSWAVDSSVEPPVCRGSVSQQVTVDCSGDKYPSYNCLSGPGVDDYSGEQGKNFPKNYLYRPSGEDVTFEIKAPIETIFNSNLYIANYVQFCQDPIDSEKYNVAGLEAYSRFNNTPNTIVNGNVTQTYYDGAGPFSDRANPFYQWTCYDEAKDVKARIRVVIRDWNAAFDPSADYLKLAYPDLGAATDQKIMDRTGDEVDGREDDWLDYYDWDDYYANGSPSLNMCSASRTSGTPVLSYPNVGKCGN